MILEIWMNLRNIMYSEKRPDAQHHVYEMSRKGKLTEEEGRLVIVWGWGS